MAVRIADNAKTQRYSPCNTMETLLVAASAAPRPARAVPHLPAQVGRAARRRGDPQRCRATASTARQRREEDWRTEYLAPILSIRIVAASTQAIAHVNEFGSNHTDAIITERPCQRDALPARSRFGSVMVNASTRFADGFEFGLGAEIGISTNKLHARGPVGLEGLTSQKFVVFGSGQIRT